MTDHEPTLRTTAADLVKEVAKLTGKVEKLDRTLSRGRHVVVSVVLALAVDLILSVGFFYVAKSNRDAIRASCQASNEARSENLVMWDGLLGLFPPSTTEQGKATIEGIRRLAHETFRQRDC